MENEKPNIHVKFADGEQVKTLIILEGEAPANNNPVKPTISGDINTVATYVKHRVSLLNKDTTVICFDEVKGTITLNADPSNELSLVVTAKSESYPDLQNFGINTGKTFSQTDLEKLVKMNKMYFADFGEHSDLLSQLRSFKAQTQTELQSEKDKRSNVNNSFKKQVTTDLAADFKLCMPLFKGQEDSTFRVEIEFDSTDSTVKFWLSSVELHELSKKAVSDAFEPQWGAYEIQGFTCVNQ